MVPSRAEGGGVWNYRTPCMSGHPLASCTVLHSPCSSGSFSVFMDRAQYPLGGNQILHCSEGHGVGSVLLIERQF